MTRSMATIAATALLLAGCNQGKVDEHNASTAEVAKAVEKANAAIKFTPGRWESTLRFLEMKTPDMPAGAAESMNRMLGKDKVYATCLSKEEAEKPAADFFAKDAKNCVYDHFTMGGGKIDAKMTCGDRDGQAVMTMAGDYQPTHYALTMTTDAGGRQGPRMSMKMSVDSKYAGACRGDEDKAGK